MPTAPGRAFGRHRNRIRAAVTPALVAVLLGGCSHQSTQGSFLIKLSKSDAVTLSDGAAVMNRRFSRAKAHASAQIEKDGVRVLVRDPALKNLVLQLATTRGHLEFRPVVSQSPPPCSSNQLSERRRETDVACYTAGPSVLDGTAVASASPNVPAGNPGWTVDVTFTSGGATKFDQVASSFYKQSLAIVLDGRLVSAPQMNERSFGGRASINGGGDGFTRERAETLAAVFGIPELPAEVTGVDCFGRACGAHS